jgi:hypothetical protein
VHRHRESAVINAITCRLLSEQRDLERAPPRRCKHRKDVVEHVLEQIAQPYVREAALGLGRSREENA